MEPRIISCELAIPVGSRCSLRRLLHRRFLRQCGDTSDFLCLFAVIASRSFCPRSSTFSESVDGHIESFSPVGRWHAIPLLRRQLFRFKLQQARAPSLALGVALAPPTVALNKHSAIQCFPSDFPAVIASYTPSSSCIIAVRRRYATRNLR